MAAAVQAILLAYYAEECALAVLDITGTAAALAVEAGVRREATKGLSKLVLKACNSKSGRGVKGSLMVVRRRERISRSSLLSSGWSTREESKREEWSES